jgi:hypothetical protein
MEIENIRDIKMGLYKARRGSYGRYGIVPTLIERIRAKEAFNAQHGPIRIITQNGVRVLKEVPNGSR